jgi:hypothetical protein
VDSSNNRVGIGTSSPDAKTEILTDGNFNPGSHNDYTGVGLALKTGAATAGLNTYGTAITFNRDNGNDVKYAAISAKQTGSDPDNMGLAFFTYPSSSSAQPLSEKMVISHGGNVGIGTSSPSEALDVAGQIASTEFGSSGGSIVFGNDSHGIFRGRSGASDNNDLEMVTAGGGGSLVFMTDGFNEKARIDSSGNVGIGTSSPDELLHVENANNAMAVKVESGISDARMIFTTTGQSDYAVGVDRSDGRLHFTTGTGVGANQAATIDPFGRLGIGTTTPDKTLDVNGDIRANGVYLGGTGSANRLDDYEEGTWTPTVSSGTVSSVSSATYVKSGNLVFFQCNLTLSGTRGSEIFEVGGLPFTNPNDRWTACPMYHYEPISSYQQVTAFVNANSANLRFQNMGSNLLATEFGNGYINVAGVYNVS